jgi:hypothetical protein
VGGHPCPNITLTQLFYKNAPTWNQLKPLNYFSHFSGFGVQVFSIKKYLKHTGFEQMADTKFKPGQSGNPAGRPKDKTPATLLRKSIAEDMPEIVKALIEQAKGGDVQAAKVLLDRICPPLRPQALPVTIETGATLPETGGNVVTATLSGNVPPDLALC